MDHHLSRARPAPPTAPADVHPLALQAIRRAAEIGIDPRRVAVALAIPLDAVPGLLGEADAREAPRA